MAVDLASPPSGGLALGCRDLCASRRWTFFSQRAMISSTWCFCMSETWPCSLLTIEDKLVWSSTWTSSLWWLLVCCNSHKFLGRDICYSAPRWAPKCSCHKWNGYSSSCQRVFYAKGSSACCSSLRSCVHEYPSKRRGGYLQKALWRSSEGSTQNY